MYQRYLIQTITLTTTTASIEFTSIPSTFADLCIKLSVRTNYADIDSYFNMNFNSDTGANYAQRSVYQNNAGGASSNSWTAQNNLYVNSTNGASSTANTFANVEIYIPNAFGSTYKSVSEDAANEHNSATPTTRFNPLSAGLWSSTAAITSIKFAPANGSWVQYSTASLYGIRGA